MNLFGKKSLPVVAVDISSTAVKVLELSHSGKRYSVESYGVASVPLDAIVENEIKNVEAVSDAVTLAVKRARTHSKYAALAIPTSSVITKVLQFDASMDELEMEAQIFLEAGQFIPYPLNEVSLDFDLIGINSVDPTKADVLVVASRTENVEIRQDVLHDSGLTAKIIDVQSYALEGAMALIQAQLPNEGLDKTIAILDFGATMTTLTVLNNLRTIYSREEVFGGRQLTEAIQRRYNLTYEEAGRMKKEGGLPDDYFLEVLTPFRESLVPLIRRSLQFFYSGGQYEDIDHIVLAGGGAHIPKLGELIKDRLGIDCSIANPFADMSLSSSVPVVRLREDSSALMVCCGLALRSFNL